MRASTKEFQQKASDVFCSLKIKERRGRIWNRSPSTSSRIKLRRLSQIKYFITKFTKINTFITKHTKAILFGLRPLKKNLPWPYSKRVSVLDPERFFRMCCHTSTKSQKREVLTNREEGHEGEDWKLDILNCRMR